MIHDVHLLPSWSRDWATKRLAQHMRTGGDLSTEQWTGMCDWLSALPDERPKMVAKIQKLTLAQAMLAQANWHVGMAARSERRRRERQAFAGDPDAVEVVAQAGGGWRWVRVLTPAGLDYEGDAMGHCVGRGSYDGAMIFSLRDANNLPHCTVQWNADSRTVEQVQGRANQSIVERYHAAVRSMIDGLEPVQVNGAGKFGHVFANGRLLHWSELPEGLVVGGSLDLNGCVGLTALPDGLVVEGSLFLSGCVGLTALPEGLVVEGSLDLHGCIGMTALPEGLVAGRSLLLSGCVGLTALPAGLVVEGSLFLHGCVGLTALPEGLIVERDLDLSGCIGMTALPERLVVKRNLDLSGCIGLTALPEGLVVKGNLLLKGCVGLTALPEGLVAKGDLDLSGCVGLTALPEGLVVGGSLFLNDCSGLTALPEGLVAEGDLDLRGCIGLMALPERLVVGGQIHQTVDQKHGTGTEVSR